jgi:hypothetical protein
VEWRLHFPGDGLACGQAVTGRAGMTEKSKSAWGREKVFALDWLGLAKNRVLGDVLRLFRLRYAWLKDGDRKAYSELARACRAADPDIRRAAEILLKETALDKQRDGSED